MTATIHLPKRVALRLPHCARGDAVCAGSALKLVPHAAGLLAALIVQLKGQDVVGGGLCQLRRVPVVGESHATGKPKAASRRPDIPRLPQHQDVARAPLAARAPQVREAKIALQGRHQIVEAAQRSALPLGHRRPEGSARLHPECAAGVFGDEQMAITVEPGPRRNPARAEYGLELPPFVWR